MRIGLFLSLSLLAAPLVSTAEPPLYDLIPARAQLVLGLKVRNLADSPVAKIAVSQASAATPKWNLLLQTMGFDPLRDIDEVMVAMTGSGQNPPTLIAVRGRRGGFRGVAAKQKSGFTFLDDSTVLGGDAALVRAALGRRTGPRPAIAEEAAAFGSRYDIFGVGAPSGPAKGTPEMLQQVDRFQIGVNLSHGMDLVAELQARTPDAAKSLAAMLALVTKSHPGAQDALQRLSVTVDGRSIRFAMAIPPEEFEKAMRQGMTAVAAKSGGAPMASAGANAPAGKPAPEPSRVPAGAVLMITGSESDGGTQIIVKP